MTQKRRRKIKRYILYGRLGIAMSILIFFTILISYFYANKDRQRVVESLGLVISKPLQLVGYFYTGFRNKTIILEPIFLLTQILSNPFDEYNIFRLYYPSANAIIPQKNKSSSCEEFEEEKNIIFNIFNLKEVNYFCCFHNKYHSQSKKYYIQYYFFPEPPKNGNTYYTAIDPYILVFYDLSDRIIFSISHTLHRSSLFSIKKDDSLDISSMKDLSNYKSYIEPVLTLYKLNYEDILNKENKDDGIIVSRWMMDGFSIFYFKGLKTLGAEINKLCIVIDLPKGIIHKITVTNN